MFRMYANLNFKVRNVIKGKLVQFDQAAGIYAKEAWGDEA